MKKIKLLQSHHHDGRNYAAGSVIEVPADLVAFFLAKPADPKKDRPQLGELFTEEPVAG